MFNGFNHNPFLSSNIWIWIFFELWPLIIGFSVVHKALKNIRLNPFHRRQKQIDQFDADERSDDTADPVNKQVPAQQLNGTDRPIFYALKRQWN